MPRDRNHIDTEQFTISTTPIVVEELKELVSTGHYGKNHAEAAERLLATKLNEIFGEDALIQARKAIARRRAARVRSLSEHGVARRGKKVRT